MALLDVTELIDEALFDVGDPSGNRISRARMLLLYNRAQRRYATRFDALETEDFFDITANERYDYPQGDDQGGHLIQLTGIKFSSTPEAGLETYDWLRELKRDEYRRATDGQHPVGTPTHYYARQEWFHLIPTPDAPIADGGICAFFRIPSQVTDESVAQLELPAFMRDALVMEMSVRALKRLKEFEEAENMRSELEVELTFIREKLEDRSKDRRTSFRPRSARRQGFDQV